MYKSPANFFTFGKQACKVGVVQPPEQTVEQEKVTKTVQTTRPSIIYQGSFSQSKKEAKIQPLRLNKSTIFDDKKAIENLLTYRRNQTISVPKQRSYRENKISLADFHFEEKFVVNDFKQQFKDLNFMFLNEDEEV